MRILGTLTMTSVFPRRGVTSTTACGPITGPVGSIMCLPVAVRGVKIGTDTRSVNSLPGAIHVAALNLALVLAVVSLAAWAVFVFAMAVTAGPIHLLLAIGVTLLVYWWALHDDGSRV